jgi:predicted deacylase
MVLKGTNPGPRLLLTAAVHGDELNGIAVIHRLLGELSHEDLSGTLIAVPGVNQSGLAANSRYFIGAGGGQPQSDPNRLFPGKLEGGGAAERYIGNLWHKLLSNNADLAVDLHTQTTGLVYPLFVFADMRNQRARRMAYALNPEMIKNDGGEKGTLETTLMENGIPAVTFEIGAPKRFQPGLVAHAVDGLKSLMATEEMLESNEDADTVNPFVGTSFHNVYAENGGPIHIKVTLGQEVQKGDLLALGYNAFGVEIKRYSANRAGRVVSLATDPLREPGALIVRILY